jgi:glycosyltransferase involved in cell wall biosynthesis
MIETTVLIPAYNCEKYISTAIESVLNQNYSDYEIVIIDDGSTDNTNEIIRGLNSPKIRFYSNPTNQGIV